MIARSAFICSGVVLTVVFALASIQPANAGTIVFSDGAFNDGDWSVEVFLLEGNGGTFTAQQIGSGGVPGSYREIGLTVNEGSELSGIAVFSRCRNATYDPAVYGAITGIAYHEDSRCLDASGACGQRGGIALKQSGRVFVNGHYDTPGYSWASFDVSGQTAVDFHLLNSPGSVQPDFSATGAPIESGFFRGNWNAPCGWKPRGTPPGSSRSAPGRNPAPAPDSRDASRPPSAPPREAAPSASRTPRRARGRAPRPPPRRASHQLRQGDRDPTAGPP
jgi:hypothetical protein